MTDLFGNPMTDADFAPTPKTMLQRVLGPLHYRPCDEEWRRCGTCRKHVERKATNVYHKCLLLGTSYSMSTDIRVYHVCDAWEKPEEAKQLEIEI